jgi:hypothetical protein
MVIATIRFTGSFTIAEVKTNGYLKMKFIRHQYRSNGILYDQINDENHNYGNGHEFYRLHTARMNRFGQIYLINFFGSRSNDYLEEKEEIT